MGTALARAQLQQVSDDLYHMSTVISTRAMCYDWNSFIEAEGWIAQNLRAITTDLNDTGSGITLVQLKDASRAYV